MTRAAIDFKRANGYLASGRRGRRFKSGYPGQLKGKFLHLAPCAVAVRVTTDGMTQSAAVRSWIDHSGEVVWEPAPSLIAQLVEAGQPFWLDIENPAEEVIDQLAKDAPS